LTSIKHHGLGWLPKRPVADLGLFPAMRLQWP
jgi:hypothetical protein